MRPSEALDQNREAIRQLVAQSGMANPRLFGSVAHGDDVEGSDLDILVDPSPESSLLDLAKLQVQIERRLGVKADVLTPKSLPEKFRERVLAESVPV